MAVEQMTHLEATIDVPSMTNAIHTNDTRLVIYSIKNPVIPLPQAVPILPDKPFSPWRAWIGCEIVNGSADPRLHLRGQTQVVSSRSALDFDRVWDLRPSFLASALTSSHAWNPVASFMA